MNRGKILKDVIQHCLRSCPDKLHFQLLNQEDSNRTALAKVKADKKREAAEALASSASSASSVNENAEFIGSLTAFSQLDCKDILNQARLVRRLCFRYDFALNHVFH